MTKKVATAKEKRHMARVAALPCCLCGTIGVQVHHITENGRRISHFITIGLCVDCHEGALGVHGDKTMLKVMKTTELKLLADTIEAMEE